MELVAVEVACVVISRGGNELEFSSSATLLFPCTCGDVGNKSGTYAITNDKIRNATTITVIDFLFQFIRIEISNWSPYGRCLEGT